MAIKRTKTDIVFSNLIRARENYTCQTCGKQYLIQSLRQGLHCSHFWTRSIRPLRWWHENAIAQCYGCHQRYGSDPYLFTRFMAQRLGQDRLDQLAQIAYSHTPVSKKREIEALEHMIDQWRLMSIERRNGNTDKLEFTGWLPKIN